ncbi:putative sodium/potassium/calcium exchanger [Natronorubrum tibetense]|uniref:Uncharacterized protein n=1 Tax=Natronorubrum tibetense GA33 TaxID=1114856 RepID=L9W098_9EURY|nr:hypothetical protein [Natronorubrum tibetense]ELY42747.1 hypothetical protein C496_05412 [Natronorubrum tibetense GA33]
MRASRSVAFLVLVAILGLTVAPVASGAVVGTLTGDSDGEDESSNEAEPEIDVSTFMQSTATDAERSVESGMHDSRYEAADNETRAEMVREQTDTLEERHADLEAEHEVLQEQKDELHRGEYQARMAQLTVEIQSFDRAIDRTEQQATETGVTDERLDELRENAATLSGPEVAEIERGLGGPDGTPGGGPPTHANAGNQTDGALGQGNASQPGQADPGNQSDNENPGQGNASPPGQSDFDEQTDDDEGQADDGTPGQGNATPSDHADAGN